MAEKKHVGTGIDIITSEGAPTLLNISSESLGSLKLHAAERKQAPPTLEKRVDEKPPQKQGISDEERKKLLAKAMYDGKTADDQKDYATAIAAYERARRLSPYDYIIPLSLGIVYSEKGDFLKAREQLLLASEMAPKDASILTCLGAVMLNEGMRYYQQALKIDPANEDAKGILAKFT